MNFDTVLLEFEGVLASTYDGRRDALTRSLAEDGIVLTSATYAECCAGFPVREGVLAAAAAARQELDETAIDLAVLRAERHFAERVGTGVSLAPGARALLDDLAGRVRLGIVTRARRREVEFALTLAGIEALFECVIAAEDVRTPKPSPEAYQHAFERLARRRPALPAATLALEDGPPGIIAARTFRLRCVAVGTMPAFHAVQADAYLPSLAGQTLASLESLVAQGQRQVERMR
jgi:HAD superfamily hydrolase (TIGR01509 family)